MSTVSLNGETRLVPIVGDPIAQVKSPSALTRILAGRGHNAIVYPAHVAAADLPLFLAAAKATRNLDAIVVTVPHKIAALDACGEPSERALFLGSVNVLHRRADGVWTGDATDGHGYLDGCRRHGFDVAGKRALLVGVGGAGSAVAYEILERGAAHLALHDLDIARRNTLVARLNERFPGRCAVGSTDPVGFDLVANATPLGMRAGDPAPVRLEALVPGQFVADIVTRPEVTPLIAHARAIGCRTMTGVDMFNAQADLLVDRILGL